MCRSDGGWKFWRASSCFGEKGFFHAEQKFIHKLTSFILLFQRYGNDFDWNICNSVTRLYTHTWEEQKLRKTTRERKRVREKSGTRFHRKEIKFNGYTLFTSQNISCVFFLFSSSLSLSFCLRLWHDNHFLDCMD